MAADENVEICPPNSSPTFSERSKLTVCPTFHKPDPIIVLETVSELISTSNQSSPKSTAVRQIPSQAMDAPNVIPAVS